jgi:protein translocase SecG subunit
MNLYLLIFLVILYIVIGIILCGIILLQKPDGSISIASMKQQSSRSENAVLVNLTIFFSFLFFSFTLISNTYSEIYKGQYEKNIEKLNNTI